MIFVFTKCDLPILIKDNTLAKVTSTLIMLVAAFDHLPMNLE